MFLTLLREIMTNDFIVNQCCVCDQFDWEIEEIIQPSHSAKQYPVYKTIDVAWCNELNKKCEEVSECPKGLI